MLPGSLSASPWAYLVLGGSIAGSPLLPLLPSESALITAGVFAGSGHLALPLVVAVAAVGSFVGDNLVYLLGRTLGSRALRWVLRGARGRATLAAAASVLDRYGGGLIVVGRFVPGGQTAVGLAAGIVGRPWSRYAPFAAAGATVWAVCGSLLGYLGGSTFQDRPWAGLLLSLGLGAVIAGLIELIRRRGVGRPRNAATAGASAERPMADRHGS